MSCSLAFYFKTAARRGKNQQQHREIRPENGDAESGPKGILDPTAQSSWESRSRGLGGGARAQTPGSGPLGFGSVATTWGRQRPRSPGPRLISYCTSGEPLVGRQGSAGSRCCGSVDPKGWSAQPPASHRQHPLMSPGAVLRDNRD